MGLKFSIAQVKQIFICFQTRYLKVKLFFKLKKLTWTPFLSWDLFHCSSVCRDSVSRDHHFPQGLAGSLFMSTLSVLEGTSVDVFREQKSLMCYVTVECSQKVWLETIFQCACMAGLQESIPHGIPLQQKHVGSLSHRNLLSHVLETCSLRSWHLQVCFPCSVSLTCIQLLPVSGFGPFLPPFPMWQSALKEIDTSAWIRACLSISDIQGLFQMLSHSGIGQGFNMQIWGGH